MDEDTEVRRYNKARLVKGQAGMYLEKSEGVRCGGDGKGYRWREEGKRGREKKREEEDEGRRRRRRRRRRI
jgi:hypothetical protein